MRLPVIATIFLFVISILVDWYISSDINKVNNKNGKKYYWFSALLCYAVLIVAICLPRREAGSGISVIMWLLFVYITIYVGKLVYAFISFIGRVISVGLKSKSINVWFRRSGLILSLLFIIITCCGVFYTRHHIVVENVDIYSNKLPETFEDYKIVQISDLHVGTWGENTTFIEKLVSTVNELHPDLIVFTGDIVNRESREATPFLDVLSKLKASDGVYSILGNHDYGDYIDWENPLDKIENNLRLAGYERGMGWKLMNNEKDFIRRGNDSIMIIGVENWGEPPFTQYGDLNLALSETHQDGHHQNDSTFKLLLSHNPEHWNQEVSKSTNIDLTLSGHTHAMQTLLKIGKWRWSPAQYKYDQWGGRYIRENKYGEPTQLYVNIGSGEVGMPARFLSAYPEVTLFTLKRGNPEF